MIGMKKKMMTVVGVALMALLLLAACGPALTEEEALQLTREAETGEAETEDAATETGEDTADAAAAEVQGPEPEVVGPGIPEVEGTTTTTDSGLQFVDVETGSGRAPAEGDLVTMDFVGMLEDGTEFANTYLDGIPAFAPLTDDDLFPGWKEGVLLMNEGGKARLIIPPDLAFGEEGVPGLIPGNATLTMDVELISAEAPPVPTEIDEGDLTTTDSGLQYLDLVEGDGETPEPGQDVVVDYAAWLQDDNLYIASSTLVDGEPLTFTLGGGQGVFPGWDEGVSTMQVGGKRFLVIPPELALGEAGGGRVPPNSTLIMEVELLEVKPLLQPTEIEEDEFTTTDSGLRYFDIIEGTGDLAEAGQMVTVNYTGWLTDGVKFDSSLDRGVPFPFTLGAGEVIEGWDEGVAGMRVGGLRQLIIPSDLAYGDANTGGPIPPGATLIFEVELLEIEDSGQ